MKFILKTKKNLIKQILLYNESYIYNYIIDCLQKKVRDVQQSLYMGKIKYI